MKTRAAVAWEADKTIEASKKSIWPDEGRRGLGTHRRNGRVPYRCVHTLRGRSGGACSGDTGHEGGGIVQESVPASPASKPAITLIPLYTPECGTCEFCLSGKTNLCQRIRITRARA